MREIGRKIGRDREGDWERSGGKVREIGTECERLGGRVREIGKESERDLEEAQKRMYGRRGNVEKDARARARVCLSSAPRCTT